MRTPLERIRLGGFVLAAVFILAILGYRFVGDYDWIAAVWMVVITISTVGYGETSQLPPRIQALTVLVIVLGISASVYTFGGLFQLGVEGELENVLGKRRMKKEIMRLRDHAILCGFGRMGKKLAEELQAQGVEIVVVDQDSDAIDEAIHAGFCCVSGDATAEETLSEAGLTRASTLVSTFPNDAECVFITLTARDLNKKIRIIARAERESTEKKLLQAGADTIVMPTVVGARQMGRMITRPSTAHLIKLVDEGGNQDFDIDEVLVHENSRLVGLSVQQTEAHRRHGLLVVAVRSASGELRFNPDSGEKFTVGEIVIVMGRRDDIARFRDEY
ncbi:MAG: potassium channel family protein [Rubripirellula sp.]|jgi:voltage-gated potassium channel